MPDERKNVKLQPEDHAGLKRRKPDDKPFGEWLLEETADDEGTETQANDEVIEAVREAVREECGGSDRGNDSASIDDLYTELKTLRERVDELSGKGNPY